MNYSRRDFGKLALAGIPAAAMLKAFPAAVLEAREKINSKIGGVTIGAITYSFRSIQDPMEILKAYQTIGLGEMELMSNHAEALAGMPSGRGGGGGGRRGGTPPTPEQIAARDAAAKATADWRKSATEATFKPVRQKIEDAGIELRMLCYNMSDLRTLPDGRTTGTTDDDIEYGFMMAKWLGVEAMSTSTQVSMAKRIAPFADKHKMMVGFHGHANTKDTNEVATPETFDAVMAASKYHGANLDIGHYTEAGYDPVAFIVKNHARITNTAPEGQEEGHQRRRQRPLGHRRHADQGSPQARSEEQVQVPEQHRVRVPRETPWPRSPSACSTARKRLA